MNPQYLRGEISTVHEFDGGIAIVLPDRIVGRSTSRHVRSAPEVLETMDEA